MVIPNWLAFSGAFIGLLGGGAGLATSFAHALSSREARIDRLPQDLAHCWTNEGSSGGPDGPFINLDLELSRGDLLGSVKSSVHTELLQVTADVHWLSSTLSVSEAYGHGIPVAEARVSLVGDRNRIDWKIISGNDSGWLPQRALLWPTDQRNNPNDYFPGYKI